MLELNRIYCGHTLQLLKEMPDGMVGCIITSPPYWGLRDYNLPPMIWDAKDGCEHQWGEKNIQRVGRNDTGTLYTADGNPRAFGGQKARDVEMGSFCSLCGAWRGSLGLEPTFQLYLDHLMQIMSECKRVLKRTGTMWVNIGDSYAGSGSPGGDFRDGKGGDTYLRPYNRKGIPAKSLVGIPERFTIRMTDELGMIRRNTIIWHKPNCMPSSAKDRFTVDFEPVYFFTKQGDYWFEQQKEPHQSPTQFKIVGAKGSTSQQSRGDPNGYHAYGVDGRNRRCVWEDNTFDWKAYSLRLIEIMNSVSPELLAVVCDEFHIESSVWDIPTKPSSELHFAQFPDTLVEPMLSAGCPPDGIVLDPFSGMGRVASVAIRQGKNFMGFDLSEYYVEQSMRRIKLEQQQMRISL